MIGKEDSRTTPGTNDNVAGSSLYDAQNEMHLVDLDMQIEGQDRPGMTEQEASARWKSSWAV